MTALVAWEAAKKAGRWLLDHWYLPLFLAGVTAGWLLTRGKGPDPLAKTLTELDAIKAANDVREVQAKAGIEAAKAHVELQHKEALAALDEKQKEEAKTYAENPQALAAFLVRVGSKSGS